MWVVSSTKFLMSRLLATAVQQKCLFGCCEAALPRPMLLIIDIVTAGLFALQPWHRFFHANWIIGVSDYAQMTELVYSYQIIEVFDYALITEELNSYRLIS